MEDAEKMLILEVRFVELLRETDLLPGALESSRFGVPKLFVGIPVGVVTMDTGRAMMKRSSQARWSCYNLTTAAEKI